MALFADSPGKWMLIAERCVCVCIVRGKNYNYNRYQNHNRYQPNNHSQSHAPWWRWVRSPSENLTPTLTERPRQHSTEPAARHCAPLLNVPCQPAAETSSQPDSLTTQLVQRTSTIISNVLSGTDGGAGPGRSANAAAAQSSSEHASKLSFTVASGQLLQPASAPVHKPNIRATSGKPSGGNGAEASSRVQPGKTQPPWLSPPTSHAGLDAQASLVRMATAPRSRREQIELERLVQEHTKKSSAAKDHLRELPPSADGATRPQNVSHQKQAGGGGCPTGGSSSFQFSFSQSEGANGISANDVIVVGEETRNAGAGGAQEPCSSNAVQSGTGCTMLKKASGKKTKAAKVPKVPASKNAKSKVKAKTSKSKTVQKKRQNFVAGRMPRTREVAGSAYSRATLSSQIPISSLIGSLDLPASVAQGFLGSQNTLSPSASVVSSQEQSSLNTLLQMSLHEEYVCSKLTQCNDEIEKIQLAITKLGEELQKRTRLRSDVSSVCFLFVLFCVNIGSLHLSLRPKSRTLV